MNPRLITQEYNIIISMSDSLISIQTEIYYETIQLFGLYILQDASLS